MPKIIRLPKGASWIRFEGGPSTHLLYQGIRWGFVYKPKPKPYQNPKSMTRYRWYSENALGNINWGRSRDEAQRLLVRSLRNELRKVKDLIVNRECSYRRLSHRDILRWGDQYKAPSGKWLSVYGPATGSNHTVGLHPYPGTEYRRPIKDVR